jgi:hypothetical protein
VQFFTHTTAQKTAGAVYAHLGNQDPVKHDESWTGVVLARWQSYKLHTAYETLIGWGVSASLGLTGHHTQFGVPFKCPFLIVVDRNYGQTEEWF